MQNVLSVSQEWRLETGEAGARGGVECRKLHAYARHRTLDTVITRSLGPYGAGLRAWPGQDRRPYVVLDISSVRTHSLVYIKIY